MGLPDAQLAGAATHRRTNALRGRSREAHAGVMMHVHVWVHGYITLVGNKYALFVEPTCMHGCGFTPTTHP